ncbi:hypothetical protein AXF42_Ash002118 [Apostasia shenzhenica]|uniref:Protein saal1 n=1 Tax=Apostasia shenzhenica TaxID=1088818 RepID=A0A2I0AMV7_9ASPA|nr:hypothetical protein AXF42_Ash002118 [Apostasia shenzhenica]
MASGESEEVEERFHEGAAGGWAAEDDEEKAPTHLPLAPSSELPDTTTIDPSYIISLIRNLLPNNARTPILSRNVDGSLDTVETSELCPAEAMKKPLALDNEAENNPVSRNISNDSFKGSGLQECLCTSSLHNDTELDSNMEGRSSRAGDGWEKTENAWEEFGCVVWDLSASKTHAEFMVDNYLLDVLLASLRASQSPRVTEICLGILGNLACHDASSSAILSKDGLVETIIDQVFLNDSTCLYELFRLLSATFQDKGSTCWAKALLPELVCQRVIWIVENTLNTMLLEKCVEFLLTIINNPEVAVVLLQPLIRLGLPTVVVDLLACQMENLEDESKPERMTVLELILSLVEALSSLDCSFEVIFPDENLCHSVCRVIKKLGKFEFSKSCVSAIVTIANILVDSQDLALQLSQDYEFIEALVNTFPIVSDDIQARNALWSILARLLVRVPKKDVSILATNHLVSIFLEKSNLLKEDLAGHPLEDSVENPINSTTLSAIVTTLERILYITEEWLSGKRENSEGGIASVADVEVKAEILLHCCKKYSSLLSTT